MEIAAGRVSGASLEWRGGQAVIAAHAVEPLPDGALVPALNATNTHDRASVATAINRVIEKLGRPRRVGLVVAGRRRQSLALKFEKIPPPHAGSRSTRPLAGAGGAVPVGGAGRLS